MRTTFYLFIGVIGIAPALSFFDAPIIDGLLTAYLAVMIAIVGLSIRPGEAGYLSHVIRPILISAVIPAAWMLIQILPMPFSIVAHPIWSSAQAALHYTVIASISVDRGATLLAFMNYCFAAGVVFVAAAVTIDRARAEFLLFWLAGITTLAAVILVAHEVGAFKSMAKTASALPIDSLTAIAALGAIVNAAAVVRAIERYETRRTGLEMPFAKFIQMLMIFIVALAICACTVVTFAKAPAIFAMLSGLATFAVVMLIRRLGLGPWVNAIIALTAVAIAAVFVASNLGSGDLTLRFASASPQASIQIAQSILSDTRWMGNGAGAFGALVPIYQDIDHSVVGPYAPTSAATIAIELGRPAFWVILTMVGILLIQILRGALQRGRDSFYPTAGASCLVLLTFEAFCDAALLQKAAIVIAATILGLAFAQSISRTAQTSRARP